MSKPTIAFLALGAMSTRMAARVLDAGYPVVVTNRTASRADGLVAAGASFAATPADAARNADVVICMVTGDAAAEAVWTHPETGALQTLRKGSVAIESSTVTLEFAQRLGSAVAKTGAAYLDAPVAGSRPQAERGILIYLVGGDAEVLEGQRELLSVMGGAIHYCGHVGSGMAMKLAVNAFFAIQVAAMGELLGMLQRFGLTMDTAVGILGEVPVTSPALKGIGGLIAKGVYTPLFPVELVEKDLRYAAETAALLGCECPTTAAVQTQFARAIEAGFGGDNIQGVARLFVDNG